MLGCAKIVYYPPQHKLKVTSLQTMLFSP